MKALVTGGAGFIGSNICAALLAAGDEVRVLDNLSSGYRSNFDGLDGVELLVGDIRDADLMNREAEGCENGLDVYMAWATGEAARKASETKGGGQGA